MPRVGTVRPACGHVVGQQFCGGIGSFLAFAQNHWCVTAQGQFIKAKQGTRIWQTLPAPLCGLAIGALTPRQWREDLLRLAVFIGPEVEAIDRHERQTLCVTIDPNLGRYTMIAMFGWALVHGLGWDRLNGNPLRCFCLSRRCLRLGGARRYVEQFCEFVAGLDVGAAIQIAH